LVYGSETVLLDFDQHFIKKLIHFEIGCVNSCGEQDKHDMGFKNSFTCGSRGVLPF
jgi:hypothetical protein